MIYKTPKRYIFNGMFERISDIFSRRETQREIQERKDLYMALLSTTFKSLRVKSSVKNDKHDVNHKTLRQPRATLESLVDEAEQTLEKNLVHQMTIHELRSMLQNILAPDTKAIFEAFLYAEQCMLIRQQNDNENQMAGQHRLNKQNKDEEKIKQILLQDFDLVSKDVFQGNPALPFHVTKLGAIKTLLDYKNWIQPSSTSSSASTSVTTPTNLNISFATGDLSTQGMDEFGYSYSVENNTDIQQIIRNNQIINLSYAPLIKEKLGYTVLSFRSTIPGAGRGIYVDGFACAGSIVAFFPGEVWPREHLQDKKIASHFTEDEHFQLSLRYDDILIDSRKSPAVVLDTLTSNPWAIAHLANHPPKNKHRNKDIYSLKSSQTTTNTTTTTPTRHSIPNCRPLAINFTSEMQLGEELKKFVPNRYTRKPPWLGQNAAYERQDVFVHGLLLVTDRDVENEELFFDYRFSEQDIRKHPDWYHVYDEESWKSRWGD